MVTETKPVQLPVLGAQLAAVLDARGPQPAPRITGIAARVSHNGRGHVRLTLGQITICVYDADALASHLDAWTEATRRATPVLGGDAFDEAEEAAARGRVNYYEGTGRLQ